MLLARNLLLHSVGSGSASVMVEAGGRILYVVASDDSEPAVSWQVAEFAKGWRAPVVLLGARRPRWLPFLEQDDRRALKRATVEVARRMRGLRAPVAGIKVAIGDPAAEARRVAGQVGASLIMVGAGIEAMDDPRAMSSTARALARTASQDVWICKPFADPHVDHVLCVADTGPLASEAVRRAAAICRRFNARLRVISVLREPGEPPALDALDLNGIALSRAAVAAAQAPAELLREAGHYPDGLLVMGATAEPVLRACPSSVLIVRAPARRRTGTAVALEESADGG